MEQPLSGIDRRQAIEVGEQHFHLYKGTAVG